MYYALTHLQEPAGAVCGCLQNSVGNAPLPTRRSLPAIQGLIELLALFSPRIRLLFAERVTFISLYSSM